MEWFKGKGDLLVLIAILLIIFTWLKTDISAMRAEVRTELSAMRAEMATKADIARVEKDLKADIARVEKDLKADIARVEADIARVETDLKADIESLKILLIDHIKDGHYHRKKKREPASEPAQ